MTEPFVPFRVKLFAAYTEGVIPARLTPRNMEKSLNDWFAELAADPDNAYDIRQILLRGDDLLIFYEVSQPFDIFETNEGTTVAQHVADPDSCAVCQAENDVATEHGDVVAENDDNSVTGEFREV